MKNYSKYDILKNYITPFIIEDENKAFYYRGLSEYKKEPGFLKDTCLTMQDNFEKSIKKFLGSLIDKLL